MPKNPWQSVVIYPNRQTEQNPIGHYDVLLESTRVHRIYLEDIAEQQTDKIGINLLQLIALEEKKAAARAFDLVERVRERSTDVQWKHRMLDLIETIMVYKLPQLDRGEIQKMLNINDVELKKTRFYQDVFAEGEREGEQKGEQKGERKGEARLIVRQLTHRCGPLDLDVAEHIRNLSIQKLEALGEALLDFSSPNDLQRWLKKHLE